MCQSIGIDLIELMPVNSTSQLNLLQVKFILCQDLTSSQVRLVVAIEPGTVIIADFEPTLYMISSTVITYDQTILLICHM